MSNILNWLKARISEPSTWAGIAVAAMAVSHGLASGLDWTSIGGAVLAAVLSEKA